MRVLQIVTLISPDGAYGGPVRVSFNQAGQLASQGDDVVVAGSGRGYDHVPDRLDGIPVRLTKPWRVVPGMGVAAIASPRMLWWMLRTRLNFDVVHVHLARDLVTLPAAILAMAMGKRVVVQTHGMIVRSTRLVAPIIDRFLVRPVLRRAEAVFYLSEHEKQGLLGVEPSLTLVHLPNGVPAYQTDAEAGRSDAVEVLYLARLHQRKRPLVFVEAAVELLGGGGEVGVATSFALVGPDGGEAAEVTAAIADAGDPLRRITYEGPLPPSKTVDRMRRASIYVLPSMDEPFPMSVLEAMAVGLPVVVTASCGLAAMVAETGSGIVTDVSTQSLVDAMRSLIVDAELRGQMGAAARRTADAVFGMEAVGRRLSAVYRAESITCSS